MTWVGQQWLTRPELRETALYDPTPSPGLEVSHDSPVVAHHHRWRRRATVSSLVQRHNNC